MRIKSVIAAVIVAGAVVGLAGCAGPATPAPSLTLVNPPSSATPTVTAPPSATPTSSPSTSPSTSPTSSAAASGSIPDSCDELGTATTREQTVGRLTAQHSDGFVRPAPTGATTDLSCNWIQEESAGLLLIISSASPSDVTTALAALPSQGYQCQAAEDFGAQYCGSPGSSAGSEDIVVAREGTWIYLETVNVNARAWLSEIASQIFG